MSLAFSQRAQLAKIQLNDALQFRQPVPPGQPLPTPQRPAQGAQQPGQPQGALNLQLVVPGQQPGQPAAQPGAPLQPGQQPAPLAAAAPGMQAQSGVPAQAPAQNVNLNQLAARYGAPAAPAPQAMARGGAVRPLAVKKG